MSAPAGSVNRPQTTMPGKKPRVSIFLATACGLGYLPKAPGTWGALGGLAVTAIPFLFCAWLSILRESGGIGNYVLVQIARAIHNPIAA